MTIFVPVCMEDGVSKSGSESSCLCTWKMELLRVGQRFVHFRLRENYGTNPLQSQFAAISSV